MTSNEDDTSNVNALLTNLAKRKVSVRNLKTRITKLNNFIHNHNGEWDHTAKINLQERINDVVENRRECEGIQQTIEMIDENQEDVREEYEENYYKIKATAETILKASNQIPHSGINYNQHSTAPVQPKLQLPALSLPNFDGNLNNWISFLEIFKSMITEDSNLTGLHKLHYLKSCLRGEALKIISSLTTTEENFDIAWEMLIKRYDNRKLILRHHVAQIVEIPDIKRQNSHSLRNLIDQAELNLKILKNQGVPTDTWDVLLIHILSSKLDSQTRQEWELTNVHEIPSLQAFSNFIQKRCQFLESLEQDRRHSPVIHQIKQQRSPTYYSTPTRGPMCLHCKGSHFITACQSFLKLTADDRLDRCRSLNLCRNCLRDNHTTINCGTPTNCKICSHRHHTALHRDLNQEIKPRESNTYLRSTSQKQTQSYPTCNVTEEAYNQSFNQQILLPTNDVCNLPQEAQAPNHHSPAPEQINQRQNPAILTQRNTYETTSTTHSLLSTAVLQVKGEGTFCRARALLDSGAMHSIVTYDLCKQLNARLTPVTSGIAISGVGNVPPTVIQHTTVLHVSSMKHSFSRKLTCFVLPQITNDLPTNTFNKNILSIPPNIKLADENFHLSSPIDILLGVDIFWEIVLPEQIRLGSHQPFLQNTFLGWVIAGPFQSQEVHSFLTVCNKAVILEDALNKQLERFWHIEGGLLDAKTAAETRKEEDQACEQHFQDTYKRTPEGRYTVKLPFKPDALQLGDTRIAAIKQFLSLERRFRRDPKFKEQYHHFINTLLHLGHVELVVPKPTTASAVCYLPHHGVYKRDKPDEIRVVFNASSTSTNKVCLNDTLMKGPTIQNELFELLIRFRTHNVAVHTDIVKMFRQILLDESDRDFQRFIWRSTETEPLQEYRIKTVIYGMACSPFLAIRSLHQLADDEQSNHEGAAKIIKQSMYVDDILFGGHDLSQTKQLKNELVKLVTKGGLELRGWASNEPELVSANNDTLVDLDSQHDNNETKVLGTAWNTENDNFKITFQHTWKQTKFTKRKVVSIVAQLYDVLGLISPIIIKGKILIQQLWKSGINWDEEIPTHLITEWIKILSDLGQVDQLTIPRKLTSHFSPENHYEIWGFSDSSQQALGACIYLITFNAQNDKLDSRLICSKSRVAPVKETTIPRLELSAAVLLSKLIAKVQNCLNLNIAAKHCFSDSQVVLAWLMHDSQNLTAYVGNRVREILNNTKPQEWHYISTKSNPADLISRGTTASLLCSSHLWWKGPNLQPPFNQITSELGTDVPERKTKIIASTIATANVGHTDTRDILLRYSTFSKITRVVAFIKRFIHNCRNQQGPNSGPLTREELINSERFILKKVQASEFASDINDLKKGHPVSKTSKLTCLHPFVDEHGLLRVGGRLEEATHLTFTEKHPIILPKHHVTDLIIQKEHLRLLHSGPTQTHSSLRQKFWILTAKKHIRRNIHNCIICRRAAPKIHQELMGNLPGPRVEPARCFLNSGVDLLGPILIKASGRGKQPIKTYIVLFICLATKAVHLDLVCDLTGDSFLNCLRRFISRRGNVSQLHSDNAGNFKKACRDLHIMSEQTKSQLNEELHIELAANKIQWKFIPPNSPNFGGIWEAAVKSCKHHLKRSLCNSKLNYQEMYTMLTRIEACLNSRPLLPLDTDLDNLATLTPAHFLIGERLTAFPEPDVTHLPINRLCRLQYLEKLRQGFWKKWSKDYLQQLQTRSKWKRKADTNLEIGQLVIIKDDNLPPLAWPTGRITELHRGNDGCVRAVTLKTAHGPKSRGISKICVLPIQD